MSKDATLKLFRQVKEGKLSRREFVRRALALGVSLSAVGPLLQSSALAQENVTLIRGRNWGIAWLGIVLVLGACQQAVTLETARGGGAAVYRNPLPVTTPDGMAVESCADPVVIRSKEPGDERWYMYCTTDPLSSSDRDENGFYNFRLIPIFSSQDLVNWTYEGDAFSSRPDWVPDDVGLWAPEVTYFNDQYNLYYTAIRTRLPGEGSALGVATSPSPMGPWTHADAPAVEPHEAPCCPGQPRAVLDAEVIEAAGKRYIYYGGFAGGIAVRELSDDGLTSDPASTTQVTISNRYEGAQVVERDGLFYLLVSASSCCNGPLSGYGVFAGRATSPLGPFVDQGGVSLLAGRVGGTPVIGANGNRWVGPGHHDLIRDFDGQDWFVYHAIDRDDPYFEDAVGFTKRPVLLDALDWVEGWPTVRGGRWASKTPQPVPAAQPGQRSRYRTRSLQPERPGRLVVGASDTFTGDALSAAWRWVREPDPESYSVVGGVLRLETQAADLFADTNDAPVLTRELPRGDVVVETRVRLNLPPEGCCQNFVQAGVVMYGDDDAYVKLVHASIFDTRQSEFAKEETPLQEGFPRYGGMVVGPPSEWTRLRVVKRTVRGEERYTAYTRRDVAGARWVRGGIWTHRLGKVKLGLVAMGGEGFTAEFDYVRVSRLRR